jgi:hypothetical protein
MWRNARRAGLKRQLRLLSQKPEDDVIAFFRGQFSLIGDLTTDPGLPRIIPLRVSKLVCHDSSSFFFRPTPRDVTVIGADNPSQRIRARCRVRRLFAHVAVESWQAQRKGSRPA